MVGPLAPLSVAPLGPFSVASLAQILVSPLAPFSGASLTPLSVDPSGGTLLQYVGTLLAAVVFYGLTAHIAARYVLGATPVSRAFVVGTVPAVVSVLLQQYGFLVVAVAALLPDFLAFHAVYRLKYRTAALVAVMHYTISVVVGFLLANVLRLAFSAPG